MREDWGLAHSDCILTAMPPAALESEQLAENATEAFIVMILTISALTHSLDGLLYAKRANTCIFCSDSTRCAWPSVRHGRLQD